MNETNTEREMGEGTIVSGDRVKVLSVPQNVIDMFARIYEGCNETQEGFEVRMREEKGFFRYHLWKVFGYN